MTMCQCAGCFPERQAKKAFDRRLKINEEKRKLRSNDLSGDERLRIIRQLVNLFKQG